MSVSGERWSGGALGALLVAARASAQTDEIHVYTGESAAPCELGLALHAIGFGLTPATDAVTLKLILIPEL